MLQTLKVLGVPFLVYQQQTFISLLRSVTTFPNAGGGSLHWPSILILKLFCSKLSIWILKFFPNVAIPRTLKFWASTSKELLANKAGDRWGGGGKFDGAKFSVFWWSVSWGVTFFWWRFWCSKFCGCFFHWKLRFGTWKFFLSEKESPSYKEPDTLMQWCTYIFSISLDAYILYSCGWFATYICGMLLEIYLRAWQPTCREFQIGTKRGATVQYGIEG